MHAIVTTLAQVPAANTAGFWNQAKVIGIIVAAILVVVGFLCLGLLMQARRNNFSHVAENLIKYALIMGFFVMVIGGTIWGLADQLAGLTK